MISLRKKSFFMTGSLLVAVWLLVAQVIGNTILLVPCLVCFMALVVWASVNKMLIPVLMFFLPWAPLIKITPGTMSVYTVALLLTLMICVVLWGRNINAIHVVPALLLMATALIVKLVYGYSISNDFIVFFVFLFTLPFLSGENGKKYGFYDLTVFFSVGIVLAALSAQQLNMFPTISRFIEVLTLRDEIRLSGYYGDPNFYSAHITAAIAGIMILVLKEKHFKKRLFLLSILVLLTYSGFISVSKSFAIVTVCMLLFWIMELLFQKEKFSAKVMLFLTVIIGVLFILFSTVFSDLLDMMLNRFFASGTNMSSLTTGRIEIWKSYLDKLSDNPLLLLFGIGYTNDLVNGRAAHNSLIQCVYQLGLSGTVMILAWFMCFSSTMLGQKKLNFSHLMQTAILIVGSIGPWFALDMMFFDEFFLVTFFVLVGIRYITDSEDCTSRDNIKNPIDGKFY
ncbi:MAG: O-antigen ligase family protein [Clostridia bacterium]|nr:O-antigen ligase family protein [Clostridia bacterium]